MKLLWRLGLVVSLVAAGLLSGCRGPDPQVQVEPGASFGSYELVRFVYEDAWSANHSVVTLLKQELARRGYGVVDDLPSANYAGKTMTLRLLQASEKEATGEGRLDELGHLRFELLAPEGDRLASARYDGDRLDSIDQIGFVSDLADELFGE